MTSTSSEGVVLRDLPVDAVATADTTTDLREGAWTRFGGGRVLGDGVTEGTLRSLAERSHEVARAQGFATGWAEGVRASRARSSAAQDAAARAFEERSHRTLAEQQAALGALAAAVTRCEETTRALQEQLADRAVELALQIAEAVLGREVALSTDPAGDAVRRALTAVPVDVPFVLRLHPDDAALLDLTLLADRPVSVVGDPRLARGDAAVETESGWVDADLAGALARVREVLGR